MRTRRRSMLGGFLVLALLTGILLLRSQYSFCQNDECFYYALVHRLWQGDALILDEWHPAQFYAPILYPWYALYRLLVPDGTGVLWAGRVSYLLFALATALLTFCALRKSGCGRPALPCACFYLLFSRSNIWGLSYYNLYVSFALLALDCCLLAHSAPRRGMPCCVLGGVCAALAVLCMPFFAVPVMVGLILYALPDRSRARRRRAAAFFAGLALTAAVYLAFLLSRGSIAALLQSLPYVLQDGEHQSSLAYRYARTVLECGYFCRWGLPLVLAQTAYPLILRRKGRALTARGRAALALATPAALLLMALTGSGLDGNMRIFLHVAVACFPAFPALWLEKRLQRLPRLLFAWGLCMGAAFVTGSNTSSSVMMTGLAISAMGAFWAYCDFCAPLPAALPRLGAVVACLAVGFALCARVGSVYRDAALTELTDRIDRGPAAGLYTTAAHKAQYDSVCDTLDAVQQENPGAPVLYSKLLPWAYLYTDLPCAAPDVWRVPISSPVLETYYALHPDKIPAVVVVFDPSVGQYEGTGEDPDPTPNTNDLSGWLWDYMQQASYAAAAHEYATVYTAPTGWNHAKAKPSAQTPHRSERFLARKQQHPPAEPVDVYLGYFPCAVSC